jgi:hypothetical protein
MHFDPSNRSIKPIEHRYVLWYAGDALMVLTKHDRCCMVIGDTVGMSLLMM